MIYYRVKPEMDQCRKNSKNCEFVIAHELYTKRERQQIELSDEAFELVNIPKSQTYWFFGARFQK